MFKLLARCKDEINRYKLLYLVFTGLPVTISQRGSWRDNSMLNSKFQSVQHRLLG